MKKRDEIEDEILDDEEFLDDEEEVLDDDEILDDEELEEEEDEKPAKKAKKVSASNKGGKKKLGKGAKAGIIVGSVVAFLAIAAVLVIWVIFPMLSAKIDPNASYQGIIGNTKPTGVTAVEEVNSNMKTMEMLNAALKNYDAVDYAANICVVGGVSTRVGPIPVDQAVQSMKIRVGKASDSNVQYFGRSVSYGFTQMGEEYYTKNLNSDKVYYRKGSKIDKSNGNVKAWNETEEFDNFDAFKKEKTTDFTAIWSYDVTDKTVTSETKSSKPTYDKKEGYYVLKVAVDITNEAAIAEYKKVMEYQLSKNMNADVLGLTFTTLEFEIGVWDNGFIRYIGIKESYNMTLSMSGLKVPGVNISNSYMNEYSYDKTEKIPYQGEKLAYKDIFKLF